MEPLLLVAGFVAVLYALIFQTYKPRGLLTFVVGLSAMFAGLVLWVEPRNQPAFRAINARATIAAATAAVTDATAESELLALERAAATAAAAVNGGSE